MSKSKGIINEFDIATIDRSLNTDISTGIMSVNKIEFDNFYGRNDETITYSGVWSDEEVGLLLGGGRMVSSVVGDFFEVDFEGSSIGIYTEIASNLGKLDMYVDETFIETVDLYQPFFAQARAITWKKTDLELKTHKLRGEIATKNAGSSSNRVGIQGYTLFPHEGIKLQQLSNYVYSYTVVVTTNARGYYKGTIDTPSGNFQVIDIIGVRCSEADMNNNPVYAGTTAWSGTAWYLYFGYGTRSYSVTITLSISNL
jgi:hypothetical protein